MGRPGRADPGAPRTIGRVGGAGHGEERVVAVQVTAPSRQVADDIGRAAVAAGLAACSQVWGPIRSTYRWRGQVETAEEWVCTCKTTAGRVDALAALVRGAHPYDVPEVVATPVVAGDAEYLAWVVAETGGAR